MGGVTVYGYTILVFNQATQANSAWSMVIRLWVGKMSASDGRACR